MRQTHNNAIVLLGSPLLVVQSFVSPARPSSYDANLVINKVLKVTRLWSLTSFWKLHDFVTERKIQTGGMTQLTNAFTAGRTSVAYCLTKKLINIWLTSIVTNFISQVDRYYYDTLKLASKVYKFWVNESRMANEKLVHKKGEVQSTTVCLLQARRCHDKQQSSR